MNTKYDVFISSSTEYKTSVVKKLSQYLRKHGRTVWSITDSVNQDHIKSHAIRSIQHKINDSNVMVILLSDVYLNSDTRYELDYG